MARIPKEAPVRAFMSMPAIIFWNPAIDADKPTNNALIATNAEVSRSESIVDRSNKERARIPIAAAILINADAFRLACIAPRVSVSMVNAPLIFLINPSPDFKVEVKDLIKSIIT